MEYVVLAISAILVKNILLAEYLGNCPFLGVSKKMDTAIGMGMAVIFVLTLAGLMTWVVQKYALNPLGLGYLQTIVFILVIASLVQLVEMFLKKAVPPLYQSLGIFLPLITTNCAILGLAVFQTNRGYGFVSGFFYAIGAGLGLTLALVLMASIREKIELSDVPAVARNMGLVLILAGTLSLAFMGFSGLFTT